MMNLKWFMKWFIIRFAIIQAAGAFVLIFVLRFFDYAVTDAVTTVFKPLVFAAILVTIILSLIISLASLNKYKARNGSLIPILINLCTILSLLLPVRKWGIRYNFNKYYEQRMAIVEEYSKENIEESFYIMPKSAGGFSDIASDDRVGVLEQDGKMCFYFSLYDGILYSEGFMYITDTDFRSGEGMNEAEPYYRIKEGWHFGVSYSR